VNWELVKHQTQERHKSGLFRANDSKPSTKEEQLKD
jgi:hypothetical protein